jgi:hypothetical protein
MERTLDLAVLTLEREVRPALDNFPKFAAFTKGDKGATFKIIGYDSAARWNQARRDATIEVTRDLNHEVDWKRVLLPIIPPQIVDLPPIKGPCTVFETEAFGSVGSSGGALYKVVRNEKSGRDEMIVLGIVGSPNYKNRKALSGPGLAGVLLDADYCRWISGFMK